MKMMFFMVTALLGERIGLDCGGLSFCELVEMAELGTIRREAERSFMSDKKIASPLVLRRMRGWEVKVAYTISASCTGSMLDVVTALPIPLMTRRPEVKDTYTILASWTGTTPNAVEYCLSGGQGSLYKFRVVDMANAACGDSFPRCC